MQQDNRKQNTFLVWLYRIEDGIVAFLLSSIFLFAVFQIILRNFFSSGFVWGDSLLRVLVLWLSLAGAIVASRQGRQINIDVLSRFVPQKYKPSIHNLNFIFAACVCLIISYFSFQFVLLEYQDATIAFGKVPAWLTESIIPFGFAVMAAKYLSKIRLSL